VLSADGRQVQGWVAAPDVLRTIARQISTAQTQAQQAEAAADWDHADPAALQHHPPTPLPGYQLTEITITAGSPVAGRTLGEVSWPRGGIPVAALRGRHLRPPRPQLTLAPGDRLSLLTPAPSGSYTRDSAEPDGSRPAGNATGNRA